MNNTKSIQLFLKERRSEVVILEIISTTMGFAFETSEHEVSGSIGFVQVTDYEQGYKQGLLITWPSKSSPVVEPHDLSKYLASSLNVDTLLEPEEGTRRWLLARPDGLVSFADIVYLADGIEVVEG